MIAGTPRDELFDLLGALCNGGITPEEDRRLGLLLDSDRDARRLYVRYLDVHLALTDLDLVGHDADGDLTSVLLEGLDDSDAGEPSVSEGSHAGQADAPAIAAPRVFSTLTCAIDHPFYAGWPVAYLLATVIFAVGLAVAAIVHVSRPEGTVHKSLTPSIVHSKSAIRNPSAAVARISGMVDCVWEGSGFRVQGSGTANERSEIRNQKSLLCLGDRVALKSGLLEITYDTGARIILQGPVAYEVESAAGGYLSVGKLTARLEKKGEWREEKGEKARNLHSPLSTLPSPLFSVRTPTAMVTDLGTEFGVEVDKEGSTTSHVFRGSIRVQAMSRDGMLQGDACVLSASQSARVERDGKTSGGNPVIRVEPSGKPPAFVRKMPRQTIKTLDLVDVVAGGDGFSNRRNRGIDATIGRPVDALWPVQKPGTYLRSDGRYHRVAGMPLVDGVFIPDGGKESVQVDSTGRRFDGFRAGANAAGQYIWAGGAMPPYPTTIGGVDYAAANHGVLLLHANNAITFDLEAMRRANPGCRVLQLRAVVGNVETASENGVNVLGDVWVLVDGKKRFTRREINSWNGAIPIALPLGGQDRFLTLAATDGGNGVSYDWIVFGDPRLELSLPETNERKSEKAM